ncbi:M15 family metallopeptidase [Microbacterium sp. 4R-513]|uniref:M15 family metallopeptidase n=1 Tax=Microbacterium sp. 4R-513 TaxID=2567934 RepID=UPI0013E0F520|nr:M15 family metallopeptidase [Microbacterium sp. 4R-513]QIG38840.1 M15 family metallopeptidase [Microbacterium sp. 4R-513]
MTTPVTRREARAAQLLTAVSAPVRHARARRAARIRGVFAAVAGIALVVGGAAAVTSALTASGLTPEARLQADPTPSATPVPLPQPVEALPAPSVAAAPAVVDVCGIPAFTAAIAAGDDAAAIAAAGGADAFRTAVASGAAPCVSLSDPARVWAVVNKTRPFDPVDYRPASLTGPGVREISTGDLRADAAASLSEMFAAAAAAGAGELALDSGYRSYRTQRTTYQRLVSAKGIGGADMVSARPGFSEHQSGLAADVTACASGCVGLESFAGTPQQQWIAAHAWEYGWIVRYEDECTAVTGYSPEPWHLRYIGRELASAYHSGGWRTLEEFLGLPPAPDYAG